MIAFGPIPSRRLGFSIGINHIPPKHCSYSCIYCQVGRTDHLIIKPREFLPLEDIVRSVEQKIREAEHRGQPIDYLTFVPDGEPTLDIHLGEEIDALSHFGYPIAVITNATMIDQTSVRQNLCKADWVSIKIDSVVEEKWRQINRPHKQIKLDNMLSGMKTFAREFSGELVTESLLVAGINDDFESINKLAQFLSELKPGKSYLSIPIRPPAENKVSPPEGKILSEIFQLISKRVPSTFCLFDAEADQFVATGEIESDILSITSVHPIREDALRKMVAQSGGDWSAVEKLVNENQLQKLVHQDETFFRRQFKKSR